MNREEQIEFNDEIEEYLQRNNLYETFSQLVQEIALNKPKNLLDFVVEQLQKPESKNVGT